MVASVRMLGVIATLLLGTAVRAQEDGATPTPVPAAGQPVAPPSRQQFEWVSGIVGDLVGPATLLERPYMTGDWGGLRTRLNKWGIYTNGAYVTDILGNPIGGEVQKVRYAHDVGLDLAIDFERMLGWTGSRFQVSMSSRAGNDLSSDIGNVFTVAEVCCEFATRLVTLAWEQSLLEQRLSIRIGRLSTGDDFLTSPLYVLFVNSDFDANPFSPLLNTPYFAYPDATWGARVRGRPVRPLYLAAGVYNANSDITRNSAHGVDMTFDGPGVLLTFEAGYEPAHHIKGMLPGHYKVGGYYDTSRYRRFGAPPDSDLPSDAEHGNGGYYFLADQMVFREQGTQGLWPFLTVVVAPNQAINTMPLFLGGGLTYQGLLPGRDADVALLGLAYGGFSRDLRRSQAGSPTGQQDFEMVLEWAYIIQITPWLNVQPDFQFILKPGGTGKIPDALVVGAQIAVSL